MTKKSRGQAATAQKPQKRGLETRDRILEAATRLLSRHGALGVTHRSVAEAAGVSLARTTYHFASKEQILHEVYDRLYRLEVERFREMYKSPENIYPDEFIDFISTQIIREATEFREESIAGCELMLEAFRSNELAQSVRKVFEEKLAFWRKAMERLNSPDADIDAQIMFCSALGAFLIMIARGKVQTEIPFTRRKLDYDFQSLVP